MPTQISSRDVLLYLNHLGYNNINAQQLKEFVQDLKKLIKYEEHKKLKKIFSELTVSNVTEYATITKKNKDSKIIDNSTTIDEVVPDIFTNLYSHGTFASRAKIVPKKESVITLHIKKSKCSHKCAIKEVVSDPAPEISKENVPAIANEHIEKTQSDKLLENKNEKKISLLRKSKSFIRPLIQTHSKSDPVALYHQYKAEWERYKIPGEDQRTELRWAVREKMLGTGRARI